MYYFGTDQLVNADPNSDAKLSRKKTIIAAWVNDTCMYIPMYLHAHLNVPKTVNAYRPHLCEALHSDFLSVCSTFYIHSS
jgi:hypothetical protein